jgi:hypothetical protein
VLRNANDPKIAIGKAAFLKNNIMKPQFPIRFWCMLAGNPSCLASSRAALAPIFSKRPLHEFLIAVATARSAKPQGSESHAMGDS